MKTLALAGFLLGSSILSANTTCLNVPVNVPDGQTVCNTAPGLGAQLFATAGQTAFVWWNEGSDFDFNDGKGKVKEVWAGAGLVKITLTFLSTVSADIDKLGIAGNFVSLGNSVSAVVASGSLVPLTAFDVSSGKTFVTGVNGGYGQTNALLQVNAPEPATCALIAIPLLLIGFAKRRRKV